MEEVMKDVSEAEQQKNPDFAVCPYPEENLRPFKTTRVHCDIYAKKAYQLVLQFDMSSQDDRGTRLHLMTFMAWSAHNLKDHGKIRLFLLQTTAMSYFSPEQTFQGLKTEVAALFKLDKVRVANLNDELSCSMIKSILEGSSEATPSSI